MAVLDAKGRIALPAELRRRRGLRPGSRVRIQETDEGILVTEEINQKEFLDSIVGVASVFKPGDDPFGYKDMWNAPYDR